MTGVIVLDVNQGRWLQIQRYFAMPCKNAHQTPRPSNAGHHPTVGGVFRGWHRAVAWLALMVCAAGLHAQPAPPTAQRQQELVRMVRQDCGSCHGMRLTGGLGPALTREALVGKPPNYLSAVIFHGIAGTPMPPWSAMLQEGEALWIAEQLAQGFPEEPLTTAPQR